MSQFFASLIFLNYAFYFRETKLLYELIVTSLYRKDKKILSERTIKILPVKTHF